MVTVFVKLSTSMKINNGKISESTLEVTAKVIQDDINSGFLTPDNLGHYYHSSFDIAYGGLIIKDLEKA